MKVLITAKNGQLGYQLQQTLPEGIEAKFCDRTELDISNQQQVEAVITKFKPNIIINAAAYTAVDKAESEPEIADLHNHLAVQYLAEVASKINAKVIHVSTDYVFAGNKNQALDPKEPVDPINVYGQSKLKGEQVLQKLLPDNHIIVRTSWVYGEHGNNFVKTMIRLMNDRTELNIINDQYGAPTYAKSLAELLWVIAKDKTHNGIYHFSDQANISWHEFAEEIYKQGKKLNLIKNMKSKESIDLQQEIRVIDMIIKKVKIKLKNEFDNKLAL